MNLTLTMKGKQNPVIHNSEGKGTKVNKTQSTQNDILKTGRGLHEVGCSGAS